MTAEVYQGNVLGSAQGIKAQWKAWNHHLRATDATWNGSVAGITQKGQFLGVVDRSTLIGVRAGDAAWSWTTADQLRPIAFRQSEDVSAVGWRDGDRDPGFVRVLEGTVHDRGAFEEQREHLGASAAPGWWIWLSDHDVLTLHGFASADDAPAQSPPQETRSLWALVALVDPIIQTQIAEPWFDDRALTYRRAEQLYRTSEHRRKAHRPRRVNA